MTTSPTGGASSTTDFWGWLVDSGYIQGDPSYYSGGDAAKEAGAYSHAITTAFNAFEPGSAERRALVDRLYDEGIISSAKSPEGVAYWVNGTEESLGVDMGNLGSAAEDFYGGAGSEGSGPVKGIASGGTLTRIDRDDGTQLWAMTYTVQGSRHVYTFNSLESMEQTLGPDAVTSGTYGFMSMAEDELNDVNGNTWLMGEAESFAGQEGSYQVWYDATLKEAALEAGARMPGAIGAFMQDPEVQRIVAEGAINEWSEIRIQAELRRTDYFQNTLYPGISTFMDQGIPNPEAAYWNYMQSVDSSLESLGYARGADGTFKNQMAEMLEAGITADEFREFAPTFVRAEQSQEFASALNKWTQRDLGVDVSFEDWFSVLEGTASAELDQVVERAQFQFVADSTSTNLDDETITRLAANLDISEEQMRVSFNQAEQSLLSVGQHDLARYGLSQEALVASAFGLGSVGVDPLSSDGSTFTAAEIQKRARKAATELGIRDDRKAQFFVGFDEGGRPVRQGLSASAPEFG